MLLRDEESIEVPEAGLNVSKSGSVWKSSLLGGDLPICWHLFESHFEEDLAKLVPDFVHWKAPSINECVLPRTDGTDRTYEDVEFHSVLGRP